MGWGHLIISRHINGSHLQILLEMFILKTCCQTGHFPVSHQNQEKTLPDYIFHTPSVTLLADRDCVGAGPSVIFSDGSFACVQFPNRGQMVLGQSSQATNPTAKAAALCLTSYSHCKHSGAFTLSLVKQMRARLRENKDGGPSFDFNNLIFIYVLWSCLWYLKGW